MDNKKLVRFLPFKGQVAGERRKLYFYRAFGMEVLYTRIFSFGACNFACPYCKRDGQFRTAEGNIVTSQDFEMGVVLTAVKTAIEAGEVVRLSGGDPVVFPEESLQIAEFARTLGAKISIAHNGSSPEFCRKMAPYLESAAIDLKALPQNFNTVAGLKNGTGAKMFERSLQSQTILSNIGVLVDVRTPIFGTTTLDDFLELAECIVKSGNIQNKFWTLRLYNPVNGCEFTAPRKDTVIWMIGEIKKVYPELKMGLRAKWDPKRFLYF
ncbi:MAG: radical SAM protein [Candidatus Pacebacteria bacterium]|nr:radical SAM protein [Candidatus Paceibacterota bacterium]